MTSEMKREIQPTAVYTLREAREFLRISDATARRWIKQGRLRARKIGRDYRVMGQDVLGSLEEPFDWSNVKLFGPGHPLLKLIGIAEGDADDVAENHDKYLADIYYEESHPPSE